MIVQSSRFRYVYIHIVVIVTRRQDRPVQAEDLAAYGTGKAAIMRNMFNSP